MGYPFDGETITLGPDTDTKSRKRNEYINSRSDLPTVSMSEHRTIQELELKKRRADLQQQILCQIQDSMKQELEETRLEQLRLEKEAELAKLKHEEFLVEKELEKKKIIRDTLELEVQKMELENERNKPPPPKVKESKSCVIL